MPRALWARLGWAGLGRGCSRASAEAFVQGNLVGVTFRTALWLLRGKGRDGAALDGEWGE